jgi:RNA polymerase sigma-70 factor (ECF subfamily)
LTVGQVCAPARRDQSRDGSIGRVTVTPAVPMNRRLENRAALMEGLLCVLLWKGFPMAPETGQKKWDGDARHERFLSLFLPEQATVRAFLRTVVWDRWRCEDLFQEVALSLWRQLDRYDDRRPFGVWARGVAAKKVYKSLRQARRAPMALSPEALVELEAALDRQAFDASVRSPSRREEALRGCIERLPDRSRALVAMRYGDGLKVTEIAVRIGSSPEAVQKALSRLRGALEKCVERRLRTK